ncbi:hypothetical protein BH20VER2_BH20VER2_10640 [soil metagenome]
MNPDKLFDYLDGKLSPAARDDVEQKLATEPQLQRQLAMAREIHRGMSSTGRREVVVPPDDPATIERAGVIGRRIATAAIVLVVLNVAIGMAVIYGRSKKPPAAAIEQQHSAVRKQLEDSLGAAGRNALPAPSLTDDEINVTAPRAQWDALATAVVAAAEEVGGSGIQAPDDTGLTVMASIPKERTAEFRQRVVGSTMPVPATQGEPSGESAMVHVRIAEMATP